MTTDLFGTSPAIPSGTANTHHHGRRAMTLGIAASAAFALFLGGMAGTASAGVSTGSTVGNVAVDSSIALTGLRASFTLSGVVGAVVETGESPITMNVVTNNIGGYSVTVESATDTLVATAVGNTESIPIGALGVRETGNAVPDFLPLSDTAAVTVHSQTTHSAELGDTVSNDFQVTIPFVNSDTYSATLNYIATTL